MRSLDKACPELAEGLGITEGTDGMTGLSFVARCGIFPPSAFRLPQVSVIPSEVEGSHDEGVANMSRETFYVYMMTNKGQTTLYIGVTNSLVRRVHEHQSGDMPGFTERYNLNRLVYYEQYNAPQDAIAREKQLKRWRREKKDALINEMNPTWEDLAESVLGLVSAPATGWKKIEIPRQARDDGGATG